MGDTILLRRGTAANLPDLQEGEPGFATDNEGFYIGDDTGTAESAAYIGGGVYVDALQYEPNTYTQATIEAALTAIGTVNKVTLLLRPGTWVISSNADWSAYTNVTFKIVPGAQFSGAYTLNIPNVDAGAYQIFDSTVSTVTLSGAMKSCYPEWWGGAANDSTDSTLALRAAGAQNVDVILAAGTYRITDMVRFSGYHRVIGRGRDTTFIKQMTDDKHGVNLTNHCGLEELTVNHNTVTATTGNGINIGLTTTTGAGTGTPVGQFGTASGLTLRQVSAGGWAEAGMYVEDIFAGFFYDVLLGANTATEDNRTNDLKIINTGHAVSATSLHFYSLRCYSAILTGVKVHVNAGSNTIFYSPSLAYGGAAQVGFYSDSPSGNVFINPQFEDVGYPFQVPVDRPTTIISPTGSTGIVSLFEPTSVLAKVKVIEESDYTARSTKSTLTMGNVTTPHTFLITVNATQVNGTAANLQNMSQARLLLHYGNKATPEYSQLIEIDLAWIYDGGALYRQFDVTVLAAGPANGGAWLKMVAGDVTVSAVTTATFVIQVIATETLGGNAQADVIMVSGTNINNIAITEP